MNPLHYKTSGDKKILRKRFLKVLYGLKRIGYLIISISLMCFYSSPAYGAGGTINWKGGASNNYWSDVDNWAGGDKLPDTSVEVAKFLDAVGGTVDMDNNYTVKQLYLDGGDWFINGSNTLTVMSSGVMVKDGNGYINVNLALGGTGDHTFNVFSGEMGHINGILSGTGNLLKTGSGELILNNSSNSFVGTVKVSAGTLSVSTDSQLGDSSNGIALSGGTLKTTAAMSTSRDISVSGTSGINTGSDDISISGIVSGSSGTLIKTGSSTLTLSGSSANTYTGDLVVSGGTLELNKTAGIDAIAGGNITIDAGATLLLSADNQINDSTSMTLNGGVFSTGGNSDTLGALTLTADSVIDFGDGSSILTFASISGLDSYTLTLRNWTGSYYGGGTDQLLFTDTSGLIGNLSNIIFEGYDESGSGQIVNTNEVAPTPEPSTIIGGLLILGFVGYYELYYKRKDQALLVC